MLMYTKNVIWNYIGHLAHFVRSLNVRLGLAAIFIVLMYIHGYDNEKQTWKKASCASSQTEAHVVKWSKKGVEHYIQSF
jgi:hypothetical protein